MNLKKPLVTALLASVGSLLTTIAMVSQAEEAPATESSKAPVFEKLDKNMDGAISKDEAQSSWLASTFDKVDANGDGYVTKSEYEKATS